MGEANGTLSVGALQSQAATVTESIRGYENHEESMINKFEPKVFQLGTSLWKPQISKDQRTITLKRSG